MFRTWLSSGPGGWMAVPMISLDCWVSAMVLQLWCIWWANKANCTASLRTEVEPCFIEENVGWSGWRLVGLGLVS